MNRFGNYGDSRQTAFCVHCGGTTETRDHAPSKVFLDLPYPDNLPFLPCCEPCNRSFSSDEEYVAAFLDCVISGSSDPGDVSREKIQRALARNNTLRRRIESRKKEGKTIGGGQLIVWEPEEAPVRNVILKLARCHAAYELNEPQLDQPAHFLVTPLVAMSDEQRSHFESLPDSGGFVGWPEVGSRAMQRLLIVGDESYSEGWVNVQEGRYRYMAVGAGDVMIRGVLSEYLGYEVIWT
jgi:hypothetical protein